MSDINLKKLTGLVRERSMKGEEPGLRLDPDLYRKSTILRNVRKFNLVKESKKQKNKKKSILERDSRSDLVSQY